MINYGLIVLYAVFALLNIFFLIRIFTSTRTSKLPSCLDPRYAPDGWLLACSVGAATLGMGYRGLTEVHNADMGTLCFQGVGFLIVTLGLGRFLFPKLSRLKGFHTLGEVMKQLYGKEAQRLTGGISALAAGLVVVAQLVAAGKLSRFLHPSLPPHLIIGGLGITMTCYAYLRCRRAIEMTSFLLFFLVLGGLAVFTGAMLNSYRGALMLLLAVDKQFFSLSLLSGEAHFPWNKFFFNVPQCFFLVLYSAIFLTPPVMHGLLRARGEAPVRKLCKRLAFFFLFFQFSLVVLGLGFATKGNVKMTEAKGLQWLVDFCFLEAWSLWGRLLLALTLVALFVATASAFLRAMIKVVQQDLLSPQEKGQGASANKVTRRQGLTALAATGCVLLALVLQDQSPIHFIHLALLLLSALFLPFAAGLMGWEGVGSAFFQSVWTYLLLGAGGGLLLYFKVSILGRELLDLPLSEAFQSLFPLVCLLSAGVFFSVDRKKHPRAFRLLPNRTQPTFSLSRQAAWWELFYAPGKWAKAQLIAHGSEPMRLGLFFIASYMSAELTIVAQWEEAFIFFMIRNGVRLLGVVFVLGLLFHRAWPQAIRHHFPLFWFAALWYGIPFGRTLFFLHDPFDEISLLQYAFGLLLLRSLVDKRTFFFLSGTGAMVAVFIYHWGVTPAMRYAAFNSEIIWQSLLFGGYTLLLGHLFTVGETRKKTEAAWRIKVVSRVSMRGLKRGLQPLVLSNLSVALQVGQTAKKGPQQVLSLEKKEIREHVEALGAMEARLTNYLRRAPCLERLAGRDYIPASDISTVNIATMVCHLCGHLPATQRRRIQLPQQRNGFQIAVAPALFQLMLEELVENALRHGGGEQLVIDWEAARRYLVVKDNGGGLPPAVQTGLLKGWTRTEQGIGLPFVQMVMEAFGGALTFKSNEQGTTFYLLFPPNRR